MEENKNTYKVCNDCPKFSKFVQESFFKGRCNELGYSIIDPSKRHKECPYNHLTDDPPKNKELIDLPLPKPIGDFIIANAKGIMGNDGVYYHYAEVCSLLNRFKDQLLSIDWDMFRDVLEIAFKEGSDATDSTGHYDMMKFYNWYDKNLDHIKNQIKKL